MCNSARSGDITQEQIEILRVVEQESNESSIFKPEEDDGSSSESHSPLISRRPSNKTRKLGSKTKESLDGEGKSRKEKKSVQSQRVSLLNSQKTSDQVVMREIKEAAEKKKLAYRTNTTHSPLMVTIDSDEGLGQDDRSRLMEEMAQLKTSHARTVSLLEKELAHWKFAHYQVQGKYDRLMGDYEKEARRHLDTQLKLTGLQSKSSKLSM